MELIQVGGPVRFLRFLPDSRRLLVGTLDDLGGRLSLRIRPIDGFEPVGASRKDSDTRLDPSRWFLTYAPSTVAFHPSPRHGLVIWQGSHLQRFALDDGPLRTHVTGIMAQQFILSPDGTRLATYYSDRQGQARVSGWESSPQGPRLAWNNDVPGGLLRLVGFLPDSRGYVLVSGQQVRIESFDGPTVATGTPDLPLPTGRLMTLAPGGNALGFITRSAYCQLDLPRMSEPRIIKGDRADDLFRDFAFHPDGRTLALIHGEQKAVKLYDRETLEPTVALDWESGTLSTVAFSPDGMLGAAGTDAGTVVIWDAAG